MGIEAKEDGATEYYEDAVLDFWTDIPTPEKHKTLPPHFHEREIWPGVIIKKGETPMQVFSRVLKTFPEMKRDEPGAATVNRTRMFAVKQLTIDLYDEMEILRGRHRKSKTTEKDLEQEFSDWAPS